MREISIKTALIYIIFSTILVYLLLPTSLGGAYQANTLPNIYLQNLGIDSHIGVNPNSIIAYIGLLRILSVICNTTILTTTHIATLSSIYILFFSFIMLLKIYPGERNVNFLLSLNYFILLLGLNTSILRGYIYNFTVPLCFIIVYFLLKMDNIQQYMQYFSVALLAWIALGFYWHTANIMMYLLITAFMILSNASAYIKFRKSTFKWNLLITLTVIFVMIWIYLRLFIIENISDKINLDIALSSFFGKGSFAGEYAFNSNLPVAHIDVIRYFGYCFAYFIMIYIAIIFILNLAKKKESSNFYLLITIFLVSDLTFQIAYFVGSGTFGPVMLLLFSYPLLIIFSLSDFKKNLFLNHFKLDKLIPVFLIIPILLTSMCGFGIYILEEPEKNINVDTYVASNIWINDYLYANRIVSDTHTTGNYQILYVENEMKSSKSLDYSSLTYGTYRNLIIGEYKNRAGSVLILNKEIWEKHLAFRSLEAWSRFEPLDPNCLDQNTELENIYDDGRILISL